MQELACSFVNKMEAQHPATCREIFKIVNQKNNWVEKEGTFVFLLQIYFKDAYRQVRERIDDKNRDVLEDEMYKEFMNRNSSVDNLANSVSSLGF